MANVKISVLPNSTTLNGSEEVPIVQSGSTVKTTTQDIANLGATTIPNLQQVTDALLVSGVAQTTNSIDAIGNNVRVGVESGSSNGVAELHNTDGTLGGYLILGNDNGHTSRVKAQLLTANREHSLPDKDGTFAMTNDLSPYNIITTKVNLTSSQILNIGTTLVTAISAPGSGKLIQLLSVNAILNWNSIAYNTHTHIDVRILGNTSPLTSPIDISFTQNITQFLPVVSNYLGGIYSNQPIVLLSSTGNPLSGNSAVDVYLTYTIITL
jgi:hypothetical protein